MPGYLYLDGVKTSRTPLRGAWIEICIFIPALASKEVAPPCGVRGLKLAEAAAAAASASRTPLRGAWIEIKSITKETKR